MRRREEQRIGGVKTRVALQKEIKEQFGEEAIGKAKLRLCARCKELNCFLLPITSQGQDCPYFKQREVKK